MRTRASAQRYEESRLGQCADEKGKADRGKKQEQTPRKAEKRGVEQQAKFES